MKFIVGMLFFLSIAGSRAEAKLKTDEVEQDRVTYYSGEYRNTSPDGLIPYSNGRMVLKRSVSPRNGRIVENIRRENLTGVNAMTELVLKLTPIQNVFSVSGEGTQSGTITFGGPDWEWTDWTVAFQMQDGTVVNGFGRLGETTYYSERIVRSAKKTPLYKQYEDLKVVDKDIYRTKFLEISNASGGVSF